MDRLRPPTGSILPVAGDGAVQGVRAAGALSRLGSSVRGHCEKLLEHLISCWQWIYSHVSWFLAFVLGVLGDSVKLIGSWIVGALKWIRLVDENPVGRIDELRARLGILVGACLAMVAIMVTLVSWEHLHGNLFSVLVCLVGFSMFTTIYGTLALVASIFDLEVIR